MKTKTLLLCCRILPAVCILLSAASCGDTQEPETDYPVLEGLHAKTETQLFDRYFEPSGNFFLYSETLPLSLFENATATLCMLTENEFDLVRIIPNPDGTHSTFPSSFITIWPSLIQSNSEFPIPDCGEKNVSIRIAYELPEDGQYDFYIQIENPEQNIYYETPSYRLTIDHLSHIATLESID